MNLQEMFDGAVSKFRDGDIVGARRDCETVLRHSPREQLALKLLGMSYAREGRLLLAEETLRLAIAAGATDDETRASLDEVLRERERVRSSAYYRDYMAGRAVYRDYPRNISIETVGRCNATCHFCPNPVLERRHTVMDDALFEKIVRELGEIPREHAINIFPNLVNEPFMDRKFCERLEHINRVLPNATLTIFTNFNVVHRDLLEKLTRVRNIRAFNVSLNAANREEYEAVMGIDFERTVANLRRLMAFNREHRIYPGPLLLSRVADHTPADRRYEPECIALFGEFEAGVDFAVRVKNRTDWLGRVDVEHSPVPHALPCGAWFDLDITCTGTVLHCCMDAHGDYAIGDVTSSSVLDVYNAPAFRAYRETLFARESVHPCSTCPLIQ